MHLWKKMTTRQSVLKSLLFVALIIGAIVTCLYLVREQPVVFGLPLFKEPVHGEPNYAVFNPFRDRNAESSADVFLELVREGKSEQVIETLPIDPEYRHYLCQQQKTCFLGSWQLRYRRDEPKKSKLFYWYWRRDSKDHERLWVTIEKRGEQWQVIDYECIY